MSNGLKGLTLAAGVVVTCLVISIGFFISREAGNVATQGMEQMGYYMEEMSQSGIRFYDGLTLSGNEVERTIKRFYGQVGVWVYQKDGTVFYVDETTVDIGVAIQSMALNPHGSFTGTVEYDEKGKVKWMIFRQG